MSDALKWSTAPASTFLDGAEWQTPQSFPGSSADTPALALFETNSQTKPWCMHRGGGTNLELLYTNYSVADGGWLGELTVPHGQQSISGPTLTAFQGRLYGAYIDPKSGLYITWGDGSSNWNYQQIISEAQGPSLATYSDRLWCVYTSERDKKLYCIETRNGQLWGEPSPVANVEASGAALVEYGKQLWCVYSPHDSKALYVTTSADGKFWSKPAPIQGQATDGLPALTVIPAGLLCVHGSSSGEKIFYYSMNTDPTQPANWTQPKQVGLPRAAGTGAGLVYDPAERNVFIVYRAA